MPPLFRRYFLTALTSPFFLLHVFAFSLTLVAVVAAYDTNSILVTTSGSVGALVAFIVGVFAKHLERKRVPRPKHDLEFASESEEDSDGERSSYSTPAASSLPSDSDIVATGAQIHRQASRAIAPLPYTTRDSTTSSPARGVSSPQGPATAWAGAARASPTIASTFSPLVGMPVPSFPQPSPRAVATRAAPSSTTQHVQSSHPGSHMSATGSHLSATGSRAPVIATTTSMPFSPPVKGLDKVNTFLRRSGGLAWVAKENGWTLRSTFSEEGQAHMKTHICRISVNGKHMGAGSASVKKHAEDAAAEDVLQKLAPNWRA